jgi:hypothetical protein
MDNSNAGIVMRDSNADNVVSHRFPVGSTVHLGRIAPLAYAAAGNYKVVEQLPEREGDVSYRIKSDREPYHRIAQQNDLEPA